MQAGNVNLALAVAGMADMPLLCRRRCCGGILAGAGTQPASQRTKAPAAAGGRGGPQPASQRLARRQQRSMSSAANCDGAIPSRVAGAPGLASPPLQFSLSTGMDAEKRHSGSYPALPACPYALLRAVVGVTDRLLPHPLVFLLVSMKGWAPLLAPLLAPPPPHTHTQVKPGMLVPSYLGAS